VYNAVNAPFSQPTGEFRKKLLFVKQTCATEMLFWATCIAVRSLLPVPALTWFGLGNVFNANVMD